MVGRNRVLPHDPHFGRCVGHVPHPAMLDGMREYQFGRGPFPPRPAMIEETLVVQHQEIQGLLVNNQGLAATHVALKQELEVTQHELQRMAHFAGSLEVDKDLQMRELYEKLGKLELDLRGVEAIKAELHQVNSDVKDLTNARQELTDQVQAMTQDLTRITADLQQAPTLKSEIESMKQELHRARAAIEYEKKGYAENYEHGQAMENKLVSMARALEKLRAEIANAGKRASAAAAVVNPACNGNYVNPEAGYATNPYPPNYSMKPMQTGAEGYAQYGPGSGSWSAYEIQQLAQGQGPG